jgi:hypothetical protein
MLGEFKLVRVHTNLMMKITTLNFYSSRYSTHESRCVVERVSRSPVLFSISDSHTLLIMGQMYNYSVLPWTIELTS